MPDIDIIVEPLNADYRVRWQTARFHQPIAERIEGLNVVVIRAVPEPFVLAHVLERRGDGFRIDIASNIEPTFLDKPPHAAHQLFDVLLGVGSKALLECDQMP